MKRLFGTDGIRGIAYSDITKELVIKVANAIAYIFNKKDKGIKVIIGNDGRESADMILSTLKEELLSCGISVLDAGLIPTPGISYLVKYYNYDLGIMISASHNPHEYNGIKIFDKEGYKLLDDVEARIEDLIFDNIKYSSTKRGIILDSRDVIKDYGNHLLDSLNKYNNNEYYVPVTKYVNSKITDPIKVIIKELSSSPIYETNLMSYLNSEAKLISYDLSEDTLKLNFNSLLLSDVDKKSILEEVIYTISLSMDNIYNDLKEVSFWVDDEEIYVMKMDELNS